jgi:hypothetical protein
MFTSECNRVWLIDWFLRVYIIEKIKRFIILVCRSVNFTRLSERWLSWPWPDSSSTLPVLSSLVRRDLLCFRFRYPHQQAVTCPYTRYWENRKISVADPWHFGVDPDPRIHASDLKIRILLFSSLTFKMQQTNNLKKVFLQDPFKGTFTSFFKGIK